MANSVTFKYTLAEADFARAKRISAREFPMYWFHWLVIAVITASAVYALYVIASSKSSVHWSFQGLPVLAVVIWLVHWWEYSVLPIRMARKMPAARVEQEVTFSGSGVSAKSKLGNSSADWAAYTRARESSEYFLLYASKYLYFPFPKRFIADAQDIVRLRELVRTHVADARLSDVP